MPNKIYIFIRIHRHAHFYFLIKMCMLFFCVH